MKKSIGTAALGLVAAGGAATWIAARRQHGALADDIERLRSGARDAPSAAAAPGLDDLPAPVARYLRLAIRSSESIREVHIAQTGTLRTDLSSDRWAPFVANHLVVPSASGFLWEARVRIAPLLHVGVRDALIDGVGSVQVSMLSAFPVSAARGGLEINSGSLHRYLAEAVWYPTALLPGPDLQWTAIDATRALATLTSHGVSVSLEFRFAAKGEVSGIFTPARWGTFGGAFKQAPWEGHFRNYREWDGFVVPSEADVGWHIDGRCRAVWRGSIAGYDVRARER